MTEEGIHTVSRISRSEPGARQEDIEEIALREVPARLSNVTKLFSPGTRVIIAPPDQVERVDYQADWQSKRDTVQVEPPIYSEDKLNNLAERNRGGAIEQ